MTDIAITQSSAAREAFLSRLEVVGRDALKRLEENLAFEEDTEKLRKAVQWISDTLDWKVAQKKDTGEVLPVFNFIINGGAVSIESGNPTKPKTITLDEDDITDLVPTMAMQQMLGINNDLDD